MGASPSSTCSLFLKCSAAPFLKLQRSRRNRSGNAGHPSHPRRAPRYSADSPRAPPANAAGPGTGRGHVGCSQLSQQCLFPAAFCSWFGSNQ